MSLKKFRVLLVDEYHVALYIPASTKDFPDLPVRTERALAKALRQAARAVLDAELPPEIRKRVMVDVKR